MAKTTDFGKRVKIRLIEMERNQDWLIAKVKEKTGLYFDSSYLYKVMTGKLATPKIVEAIVDILDLKDIIREQVSEKTDN